jgi:hypothetical protein
MTHLIEAVTQELEQLASFLKQSKVEPSITIAALKKVVSSYPVKSQLNESFLSYSTHNIFLTEITKLPEIPTSVSLYVSSNQELLFKTIKREGLLTSYIYAAAYLSTKKSANIEENQWKYLLLSLCINLSTRPGFEKMAKKYAASVRILYCKNSLMLGDIPSGNDRVELYEAIRTELKAHKQRDCNVQNLIYLFEQLIINKKERNRRNPTGRGISEPNSAPRNKTTPAKPQHEILSIQVDLDDPTINVSQLWQKFPQPDVSETDIIEDTTKHHFLQDFLAGDDRKKSPAHKRVKVEEISHHITVREKLLTCDVHTLTDNDVGELFVACATNPKNPGSMLLTASLLIGMTVDDLLSDKILLKPLSNGFMIIEHTFKWPELHKKVKAGALLTPISHQPSCIIPCIIGKRLEYIREKKDTEKYVEQAQNRLKAIKKDVANHLTLGRIARHLAHKSKFFNLTQTELCLLTGYNIETHAGTFYSATSMTQLWNKHYAYMKHIHEVAKQPFSLSLPHVNNVQVCGSNGVIDSRVIPKMFSLVKDKLQATSAAQKIHNLYTIYTLQILNYSSAHRPINKAYGTLVNFDLHAKTLVISDKRMRQENPQRTIVLPNVAIEQLSKYIEWLRHLTSPPFLCDKDTINKWGAILDEKHDLFTIFNTEGKLVSLSSSLLADFMDDILPAHRNANRHFLKSYLDKHAPHSCAEAIDAFFGHENQVDESYSRFSGLGIHHLKKIAQTIDVFLQNNNITAIDHRGRRV